MGWSIGWDSNWSRDIGYGVPCYCDHPGCNAEINRGLSYVCGGEPLGGEYGCGLYFCEKHLNIAGNRRENKQLCSRCYHGKKSYEAKPDHPTWISWKLTDESWDEWRNQHKEEVKKLREVELRMEVEDGEV